ncbi:hypothetical protein E2C01_073569 [Portunus trituberculatus]|uniref:Uncharacterized protein n=1 Tax=Portunus trituberculatus TaxID=210409 RepID=A0A5B7IC12_PORTR|nr:hypothetical protein [Portunus trituberculatus]
MRWGCVVEELHFWTAKSQRHFESLHKCRPVGKDLTGPRGLNGLSDLSGLRGPKGLRGLADRGVAANTVTRGEKIDGNEADL